MTLSLGLLPQTIRVFTTLQSDPRDLCFQLFLSTIFVTLQLIVTLDSIRNSCDVWLGVLSIPICMYLWLDFYPYVFFDHMCNCTYGRVFSHRHLGQHILCMYICICICICICASSHCHLGKHVGQNVFLVLRSERLWVESDQCEVDHCKTIVQYAEKHVSGNTSVRTSLAIVQYKLWSKVSELHNVNFTEINNVNSLQRSKFEFKMYLKNA